MNQIKQIEKNERFKIQIIKKNVKRIQSTPQKLPISTQKANKADYTSLSRKKSQNRFRQAQMTQSQQLKPLPVRHIKSKSELPCQVPLSLYLLEGQYGIDSQTLNLLMQKQIYKDSKNLEQLQQQNRKYSQHQNRSPDFKNTHRFKRKFCLNSPFQNFNIVKCQSITLVSAQRKDKIGIKTNKLKFKPQTSISRRKIKIANINASKILNFGLSSDPDILNMRKIKQFMDFCYKVNFSNKMFINMQLKQQQNAKKYKAFVALNNNGQLVKNIIKKRNWFQITDKIEQSSIRFYWTPYPVKGIYQKQKNRNIIYEECPLLNTKKTTKIDEQTLNMNEKILMGKYTHKVQNFILVDGYIPAYSQYRSPIIISNHLSGSSCIAQKKKLFRSLFQYYNNYLKVNPFTVIPVTYNVVSLQDPQYKRFMRDNQSKQNKIWIVKPGQDTNRGQGICLAKTLDVSKYIHEGHRQTYVIQSYIDRPLLYNGRKFDIRHFMLVTSINGNIKAYWFKEGYIRTSSQVFDLENISNKFVHLTNDAVQKYSQNYGTFQPANKVSYNQFQRYLDTIFPSRNISFQNQLLKQMKQIVTNVIRATYRSIDSKKKQANFELFGLDFMIDRDLKPWLIQVNQNPCLQTNCHLLSRLIPSVIENTMRLCIDPLFPPLSSFFAKQRVGLNENYLKSLKFQIIFDQFQYESDINKIDIRNFSTQ